MHYIVAYAGIKSTPCLPDPKSGTSNKGSGTSNKGSDISNYRSGTKSEVSGTINITGSSTLSHGI